MMIMGDLDFDGVITDQLKSRNPRTSAPYVPAPEFTSFILILFSFVMVVLFMNLLVSMQYLINKVELRNCAIFS